MGQSEKKKKSKEDYRRMLKKEQREMFDRLVDDYRFASTEIHGQGFVSYAVLAKLIEAGWRRSAE